MKVAPPPSPHTHYPFPLVVSERRKLFGEPTSEIQDLTQDIKGDLARLNRDIASLQDAVKKRSSRYSGHMKSHSSTVVVSLQVSGAHLVLVEVPCTI